MCNLKFVSPFKFIPAYADIIKYVKLPFYGYIDQFLF